MRYLYFLYLLRPVLNKTVIVLFVIAAFVSGSIMTGTMAFAAEKPNGDPFKAIWAAITGLQTQIDNMESSTSSATYYTVESTISTEYVDGQPTTVTGIALCNAGDSATGGGAKFSHPSLAHYVENQFPHTENGIPVGWTLEIHDLDARDGDTAIVYAVCVHNP